MGERLGDIRFLIRDRDAKFSVRSTRCPGPRANSFPTLRGAAPAPLFEANGDLFIDYLSDAAQWPTDLQTWERFACQVAGRDLTRADWNDVLPDRPYRHVCPQ